MLEGLNKGRPKLAVGKSSKVWDFLEINASIEGNVLNKDCRTEKECCGRGGCQTQGLKLTPAEIREMTDKLDF